MTHDEAAGPCSTGSLRVGSADVGGRAPGFSAVTARQAPRRMHDGFLDFRRVGGWEERERETCISTEPRCHGYGGCSAKREEPVERRLRGRCARSLRPAIGSPACGEHGGELLLLRPGDEPGAVMLFVGAERESVEKICPSLELATRITAEWIVEAFHLRATEHQSKRRRRPAARPLTGSPPAPARRIPP